MHFQPKIKKNVNDVIQKKKNKRLPNGHINVAAFDRLATIVGAFTKHMTDVNANLTDAKEYEDIYRHMQTCKLLTDAGE